METPYSLRPSIKNIVIESCIPRFKDVVLDLNKVQYTYWSSLFRNTARAYNLLHHIDPTILTPSTNTNSVDHDDMITQDAMVLTWIYATISPYLLARLLTQKSSSSTTATDAWARLRDMCQQHDTAMQQQKKRRLIDIDLNEDYRGVEDHDEVDLISNLADDVLLHMLSLVGDMKTVARTSILSKRWIHVWTRLMDLDFNDPKSAAILKSRPVWCSQMYQFLDSNFVNMVNRATSVNRAPYLNTLRIQFPLDQPFSYSDHIHNWLKFALGKEVRNLVLILGTWPTIFFFKMFSSSPALNFNTTLTTLHLESVTIEGALAFLQWVLTNCLNLQSLSLRSCRATPVEASSFKHPRKLVVSSLTVKHLEFFHCLRLLNIKALHLSAPNLTSFILYENNIIDVEYHSLPSFVDATWSCLPHLDTLSRFSSQLEKLTIQWNKVHSRYSGFPTFVNVQQLEIIADDYWESDLSQSTSLIEACPLLHTFKLKLIYGYQKQGCPDDAQINAMRTHQHLKTVEYSGYTGSASPAELALCLTRHAPMLRRFIFYTDQRGYMGNPRKVSISDYKDRMAIVRKTQWLAKRIQGSNGLVDVVIL